MYIQKYKFECIYTATTIHIHIYRNMCTQASLVFRYVGTYIQALIYIFTIHIYICTFVSTKNPSNSTRLSSAIVAFHRSAPRRSTLKTAGCTAVASVSKIALNKIIIILPVGFLYQKQKKKYILCSVNVFPSTPATWNELCACWIFSWCWSWSYVC